MLTDSDIRSRFGGMPDLATRARTLLDRGALSWIDRHPDGCPPAL